MKIIQPTPPEVTERQVRPGVPFRYAFNNAVDQCTYMKVAIAGGQIHIVNLETGYSTKGQGDAVIVAYPNATLVLQPKETT